LGSLDVLYLLFLLVVSMMVSITVSVVYYYSVFERSPRIRLFFRIVLSSLLLIIVLIFIIRILPILILNIYVVILVAVIAIFYAVTHSRIFSIRRRYRGPFKLRNITFYVFPRCGYANAWYDYSVKRIVVTEDLLNILNEDELYIVLMHESMHRNDPLLRILKYAYLFLILITLFINAAWIIVILNYIIYPESLNVVLWNFFGIWYVYMLITVLTVPLMITIDWISEHVADEGIVGETIDDNITCLDKLGLLLNAMVKIDIYNNIDHGRLFYYRGVYDVLESNVQEVLIPPNKLFKSMVKELLKAIFISIPRDIKLYYNIPRHITHPPPFIRISYLYKYCLDHGIIGRDYTWDIAPETLKLE
jgi:Zn-dependent protease with chaperone function